MILLVSFGTSTGGCLFVLAIAVWCMYCSALLVGGLISFSSEAFATMQGRMRSDPNSDVGQKHDHNVFVWTANNII